MELQDIENYYSDKIKRHGATPEGVDWNSEKSQTLRFKQLCKLLPEDKKKSFTISDLGCGYAALHQHLKQKYPNHAYIGYDLSEDMINISKPLLSDKAKVKCGAVIDEKSDYGIASGIFNVRLETSDENWFLYILSVLKNMDIYCKEGFAFNCLTSYSDKDKMKDYLYYADPAKLFDFCKREFSQNVALLHDYSLYEFTLLVRK